MIEVEELEAGARLSSLLDKVAKGEEVLITRHDKAVARLVPVLERDREKIRATIDRLLEHRETTSHGGDDWKALRDDGRR